MATHGPRIFRSVLEVERKFVPPVDLPFRITANQGPPAFKNIRYLGKYSFEDTYYDHVDTLFSHGIWLRNRSGTWQAKIRCGGDMVNSQFKELSSVDNIRVLVERHSRCTGSGADAFGLTKFARFVTQRRSWTVDERFEIVLDETDFGHIVGEVELQRNISGGEENAAGENEQARDMDREIECFMDRYRWAFPTGTPVGKLAAYCAMKRR